MSDEPIWVNVPGGAYPIFIGYDLFARSSAFWRSLRPSVCIISHAEIASHYFPSLEKALVNAGAKKITSFLIPSGDANKTLSFADKIWSFLATQHYHRDTTLVALGGGMIGDLVGFTAACYMRGIDLVQCPTSLLAQVDAAVGGKTAVNHPLAKNLIGLFHQPKGVLADLGTLSTLPDREFVSGLAELIKYGVTLDIDLFEWLEAELPAILSRQPKALEHAVSSACRLKAQVVSIDERDQSERMILNFGHTVAHAVEKFYDYEKYLHGEAVAMGMLVALRLSLELGYANTKLLDRLVEMLTKASLPTSLPNEITIEAILANIRQDKKHSGNKTRWILIESLGQARIQEDVPETTVRAALKACGASDFVT